MSRFFLTMLLVASLAMNVYHYQGEQTEPTKQASVQMFVDQLIRFPDRLQKTYRQDAPEQPKVGYQFDRDVLLFTRQQNGNTSLLSGETSNPEQVGITLRFADGSSTPFFSLADDVDPQMIAGMGLLNPLTVFVTGSFVYVDVTDDRGAGDGGGNLLRLKTRDGESWQPVGCYYMLPDIEDIYPWGLRPNPHCVTDSEDEMELVPAPTADQQVAFTVARTYLAALAYGWYDQAAELYQSAEGVEQLRGIHPEVNRYDLPGLFDAGCNDGLRCEPVRQLAIDGSGDGWVSFSGIIGTGEERLPIGVSVVRVGWFDDQPLWRITSTPRDQFFVNQE